MTRRPRARRTLRGHEGGIVTIIPHMAPLCRQERTRYDFVRARPPCLVAAMPRSAYGPADAFSTARPPSGRAVAHRWRVIVALLQQAPHGVTGREMQEATGFSTALTVSALRGLFVYGVVHKQGHCYVLTAPAEAREPSAQR